MTSAKTQALALLAPLLLGAMLPHVAVAEAETRDAATDQPPRPIDPSGELTRAELLEYTQLFLMADPRPPLPAAQGAIGAAIGQLGFSLVTGGSGAGQDLARPSTGSLHPNE